MQITSGYEAMALALPPEHLPQVGNVPPCQLMERLLLLAARLKPRQLATGNWQLATGNWQLATGNWQLATGNWQACAQPKVPKGFVDASLARSHVATARLIKAGQTTP
ncbi:MAG: hypothetical protein PHU77_14480 [Simplicispira sp.]|nr:hypothetical protein [Simplicispira sp.]